MKKEKKSFKEILESEIVSIIYSLVDRWGYSSLYCDTTMSKDLHFMSSYQRLSIVPSSTNIHIGAVCCMPSEESVAVPGQCIVL